MTEILQRYKVNVLNISIRHAQADSGSLLAYAPTESFAFVLYHKQSTSTIAQHLMQLWTREIIQAAIECSGRHYLPYQICATATQFHQAYPHAKELFELKRCYDPHYRFRNQLFGAYYQ